MPIIRATRKWSRRTWAVFRIAVVVAVVVLLMWQLMGVVFHAAHRNGPTPAIAVG